MEETRENVAEPLHTEELPTYGLDEQAYLEAAQSAASLLHWHPVQAIDHGILFRTPPTAASQGELVAVVAQAGKAHLSVTPLNHYFWHEATLKHHAQRFMHAMHMVLAATREEDQNIQPANREPYGALLISKTYLVTPLLLYINVLVYLAMVVSGVSPLSPTARTLFYWGGNLRPAFVAGEWWRLVSYMFLHAGFLHILMNGIALLYIGMYLEPLIGKLRFASAYILTGICAGLLSIWVHSNSVGVGASGAIFGMYGVFLSLLVTKYIKKSLRRTMLRSILFFVLLNLLYGMQGNTDNAAHIGGLLSGIAIGYVMSPGIISHAPLRRQALIVAALTVAVAGLVVGCAVWLG